MARSREGDLSSPEAILSFARRTLGMGSSFFYAPGIPPDKLANARAEHAMHLPEEEPVLVLYDSTVFGGADEGFLVTPERLCWKNLWAHPRQIPWSDIVPASIKRESGEVRVAGGSIQVSGEHVANAAAFFTAMASRSEWSQTGPYRSVEAVPEVAVDAVDAVLSTERLISLARMHVGAAADFYFHPSIPAGKLENARATHADHLPEDEVVAVLFDDTVFGGAKEGFLLTSRRLCWKNISDSPQMLPWGGITEERITVEGSRVGVMNGSMEVTARSELLEPVTKLLRVIVGEARGGG